MLAFLFFLRRSIPSPSRRLPGPGLRSGRAELTDLHRDSLHAANPRAGSGRSSLSCRRPPVGRGDRAGYPWRCLCRGSVQITMTRPWRRITLHLSQIGFTLGFTFMAEKSCSYSSLGPTWCGPAGFTCSGTRCGPGSGRRARAPPRPGPRAGCGCSAAASCR